MKKICFFTATRAEYGLLRSLMTAVRDDPAMELQVIVSGVHLPARLGNTVREIENDRIPIALRLTVEPADDTPRGTCGAMGERAPAEVMGEIIEVLDGLDGTMWVRDYEFLVPFGMVRGQGAKICTIEGKSSRYFYVNAGIYVLQPVAINIVARDSFYDMPQLYQDLIDAAGKVCSFPVKEYWLDIGRPTEFERAQNEYAEHFDV